MTGTPALIIQLLGGAGFLAGMAALLHFLNTAKGARIKSSADAYTAYSAFVGDAMQKTMDDNARLNRIRGMLIDLAQALIATLRARGGKPGEVESYQDRLDDIRTK